MDFYLVILKVLRFDKGIDPARVPQASGDATIRIKVMD